MSILIKGMDMPKNCYECPVRNQEFSGDGMMCGRTGSVLDWHDGNRKRMDNCPLGFVQPHGDLIDRNKLYKQTAEWEASALRMVVKTEDKKEREKWMTVLIERGAFKHDVTDAPTVIEAESEC